MGTEAFWFNVVLAQQVNTFIIDGASLTVAMGFEEMKLCVVALLSLTAGIK